ncbi:nucleocapsid [Wuhan Fly Virus 2]|uniref:Nucleoprotein n=1 Tax=Wuhan Fly Virus 2 TaxID=1608102 RepID=A0A0B5KRL2_9RHAB|nr:nucleocapsid [Wuhan Fly Virus 2]AJG39156.1 nucleocapsid [Wuhan Fly Virus 2]
MSGVFKIVSVSDQKKIEIKNLVEGKKPVYPSTWFSENPGKPKCIIPKINTDMKIIREHLKNSAENNEKVNFNIAMKFMVETMRRVEETNPKRWVSYNVEIAAEGAKVSPLSLIEIIEGAETQQDIQAGSGLPEDDPLDKWLMIWLLSVYRVDKTSDLNYRKQVCDLIERQMSLTGIVTENLSIESVATRHASWVTDQSFRVLVAAIDMFFFKFEKNIWAPLRVSTTSSRFRDCAALVSYGMIAGVMGLKKQGELALWMFTSSLAEELKQMFSTNEEFDIEESYFPYQMDFGLTPRSPYSSRMNPCIYFFSHVIGVLQGEKRSQNARMTIQKDVIGVLHNARLVGYVFMSRSGRAIQFIPDDANAAAVLNQAQPTDNASEELSMDMEPSNRSPTDWFTYYDNSDGQPNNKMIAVFRSVMSTLINQRQDTIGEFLRTNLYR